MMVRSGDADGMVSGAMCTTANTIRPALQVRATAWGGGGAGQCGWLTVWLAGLAALAAGVAAASPFELANRRPRFWRPCTADVPQVLKTPQKTLVSSIFFMCLPDKVPLYILFSQCTARPCRHAKKNARSGSCHVCQRRHHANLRTD